VIALAKRAGLKTLSVVRREEAVEALLAAGQTWWLSMAITSPSGSKRRWAGST
jgi:hypothetical protein